MIEQIKDFKKLNMFNETDIYSVRVKSLALAYGFEYPFARFYTQTDDNGNVTAAISALDFDYTLAFTDEANQQELLSFFDTIGFATLLSSDDFDLNCNYETGSVMKSVKSFDIVERGFSFDEHPNLTELFKYLDYDNKDFDSWYVDLNHRIRHNTAKAASLCVDGQIASVGILSSITPDGAILSGVKTQDDFRNNGYGSALVKSLVADVGVTVYLMREENKNEKFYINSGFINDGKWRLYR